MEKTITHSSKKVNAQWEQLTQGLLAARQRSDYKLNTKCIDSLQQSLVLTSAFLSKQIQAVSTIKETDKEIALKDTIISYLQQIKEMQDSAEPLYLDY